MRKRFEEELSKLAFGDVNAEEARRLEMQTLSDPEASQTFQTYCRMKEELRSLAEDVPADQLSKERLREAILNRGMKEQAPRVASKPTWIWMPAMAAVLAFGVVFVKGQLSLGGKPNTAVVANVDETKLPEFNVKAPVAPDPVVANNNRKTNLVVAKEPVRVAANVGRPSRSERYNDDITDRNKASAEIPAGAATLAEASHPPVDPTKTVSFDNGAMSETVSRDLAKPMVVAPGASPSTPKPTMVLIQSETDADTGTLKAKEVSSTANVVVGG